MSALARLRRLTKDLGLPNAALYVLDTRLAGWSGGRVRVFRYHFVEQPVAAKNRLPASRGANVTLRWVVAPEPALTSRRPPAVIAARFASGAVCLVAEVDGRFGGFLWLNLRSYVEDEVRSIYAPEPAATSAWDFDVLVDPAFRMGFVFARLWDEANRFLRERGVRSTFSRISAFNAGSIGAHARLGMRRIGGALYVRVFGIQWMVSSVRPHWHWSMSDADVPTLRLTSRSLADAETPAAAPSASA